MVTFEYEILVKILPRGSLNRYHRNFKIGYFFYMFRLLREQEKVLPRPSEREKEREAFQKFRI